MAALCRDAAAGIRLKGNSFCLRRQACGVRLRQRWSLRKFFSLPVGLLLLPDTNYIRQAAGQHDGNILTMNKICRATGFAWENLTGQAGS
jgi:hypothetical protein